MSSSKISNRYSKNYRGDGISSVNSSNSSENKVNNEDGNNAAARNAANNGNNAAARNAANNGNNAANNGSNAAAINAANNGSKPSRQGSKLLKNNSNKLFGTNENNVDTLFGKPKPVSYKGLFPGDSSPEGNNKPMAVSPGKAPIAPPNGSSNYSFHTGVSGDSNAHSQGMDESLSLSNSNNVRKVSDLINHCTILKEQYDRKHEEVISLGNIIKRIKHHKKSVTHDFKTNHEEAGAILARIRDIVDSKMGVNGENIKEEIADLETKIDEQKTIMNEATINERQILKQYDGSLNARAGRKSKGRKSKRRKSKGRKSKGKGKMIRLRRRRSKKN